MIKIVIHDFILSQFPVKSMKLELNLPILLLNFKPLWLGAMPSILREHSFCKELLLLFSYKYPVNLQIRHPYHLVVITNLLFINYT